MYTAQWAKDFEGFNKEDPIDLRLFMLFFEEHIASKHFKYTTNHKRIPTFTIVAEGSQLPHLMGLQYWNNLPTKTATTQYQKMRSGEWNLDFLKSADERAWDENRERLEFTPYLYTLLHDCECTVKLINKNVPGSSFVGRRIDMIFQKEKGKLIFAVELREMAKENFFRPISITTHRKESRAMKENHTLIKVTSINVIPLKQP